MTRDNVEYVPEWIYRQDVNQPTSHTSADPLSVDEEPWQLIEPVNDTRGSVVGLALLVLAFAAGVVVGWWLG